MDWVRGMEKRNWMALRLIGLGWPVLLAVVPGLAWSQSAGGANTFQIYNKPVAVPDFSLEDISGKMIHIKDFRGKTILLNFWATW